MNSFILLDSLSDWSKVSNEKEAIIEEWSLVLTLTIFTSKACSSCGAVTDVTVAHASTGSSIKARIARTC